MDGRRWNRLLAIAWLIGALPACSDRLPTETLPTPRETLAAAGKRLSRSLSPGELTTLSARGDRVLAALTREERDALSRGYFRFRVDRPVIVDIAAPDCAIPFWLADLGFSRTDRRLGVGGTDWALFRKTFGAGWVGLGVNALDRTAQEHYAVLIRASDCRPITPEGVDSQDWRIATAREGVGTAFDAETPIRRLPDELRGATLLQASRDRRHSTLLARGRVWKTHVVSGRMPDQVAIAFGPDPSRDLVWTWRTAPEVTATAIRLAPGEHPGDGDPRRARIIRSESSIMETPDLLNDATIRRHHVAATDLEPDTVYAYSLGDGSPDGWSPWKRVRTAPERPRKYSFMYLGDAQCGLEAWGNRLRAAHRRRPDVGFILLAGDLVDRGNERTNWDHFFLRAAGVFDTLPLMPCVGNHEYLDQGPRLYRATFDLPSNGPEGIDPGLVYAFEYADSFVAVLDSTLAVSDPRLARMQAEWLDRALAATRATWKFVMFHHPVYASHTTRDYPVLRDAWVPTFDKHHVDMVFQGHDHAYLRTYPLRANLRVESDTQGTTYVVSVSGDKYCDQAPRDYTAVGLTNLSTYQTIDIEVPDRRLIYRAWDDEGREVDRLVIEKPRQTAQLRGPNP